MSQYKKYYKQDNFATGSLFFDNIDEIDNFNYQKNISAKDFCNKLISNIKKSLNEDGAGCIETEYYLSKKDLRTQPFFNGLIVKNGCFEKTDYQTGVFITAKSLYEFAKADLEIGIYHKKEDKVYSSVEGFKNHLSKEYGENKVEEVFKDKVLNEGVRHVGVVYYHQDSNVEQQHYIKMPELWSFSNPNKLVESFNEFKRDFETHNKELHNIVDNFKTQDLFKHLGTDLGEVLKIDNIISLSPNKYDEFVDYCKTEEQREIFEQAFKIPLEEKKEEKFNHPQQTEVKEISNDELNQKTNNKKNIEFKGLRSFNIEKEMSCGHEVDVYKDSKNKPLNGKFKISKPQSVDGKAFINLKDGKLENYLDNKGIEQPAYVSRDRISTTECFYKDGLLHNTKGPAYNYLNTYDSQDSFNRYYIKGSEVTKEDLKIHKDKEDFENAFKKPTLPNIPQNTTNQQFKSKPSLKTEEQKQNNNTFQGNKTQPKTKRIEI